MKQGSWLPAAPEGAPRARALIRDVASELSLDDETMHALMLATTEAFANAIQHGAPCEQGGIWLRIERCARGIEVEVCDCGGCFPEDGARSPKPDGEGGRGITIISELMDSLEVFPDTDRTRVLFQKWVPSLS